MLYPLRIATHVKDMATLQGTAQPKVKERVVKEEEKEEEKEEVKEGPKEEVAAMAHKGGLAKGSAKDVERTEYHSMEDASYVGDPTSEMPAHRRLRKERGKECRACKSRTRHGHRRMHGHR